VKIKSLIHEILEIHDFKKPIQFTPLSGGDINEVLKVNTKTASLVIKINQLGDFPDLLEKEFKALLFFKENFKEIKYANPICFGSIKDIQYLLLEYEEPLKDKFNKTGQKQLGVGLAKQHNLSNEYFGWDYDNYIGSLKQQNTFSSNWADFYAENRLLFQTKQAYDSGIIERPLLNKMEKLCSVLAEIYPEEKPSLLHGDLWGGNYFLNYKSQPFLYDPAIYFGHREMDIGMTQLFGGFSENFMRSYNASFPMEKGWKERLPFSQLYPNLVHLNLFGSAYLSSITRTLVKF
jgi:fructosamine-3-kinase